MTGDTTSASAPQPATGATDVPRDVVLSWAAGESAGQPRCLLGHGFRRRRAGQPHGRSRRPGQLGPERDLVRPGARPSSSARRTTGAWMKSTPRPARAVHKGGVWSFTVEPYAYPITGVTATASSSQPGMGAQNTVNGSGLDKNDLHCADGTHDVVAAPALQPNWIQYQFDKVYRLSRAVGLELQRGGREHYRLRGQERDDRVFRRRHDLDGAGRCARVRPGARLGRLCRQHDGQFQRHHGPVRQADDQEQLGRHQPCHRPERSPLLLCPRAGASAAARRRREGREHQYRPGLAAGTRCHLAAGLPQHGQGGRGQRDRSGPDRDQSRLCPRCPQLRHHLLLESR